MKKLKKAFILLVLATAFVFFAQSLYILFSSGFEWGDMKMTSKEFVNVIMWFTLKLTAIYITVIICKKNWY